MANISSQVARETHLEVFRGKIRLVLLDWFGVVVTELSKALAAKFGFSDKQREAIAKINSAADRNEVSVTEVYEEYARLMQQCDGQTRTAAQVKAWLDSNANYDHDLVGLIDQLRAQGIKVVVASNAASDHRQNLVDMGMLDHFDKIYVSSSIGWDKPSSGFFDYIVKDQGAELIQTLFIDDTLKNVEGARAAGLYAEQYGEFGDLEGATAILTKYNLLG